MTVRCTGCGSTETIEHIRARGYLSCCPERDMQEVLETMTMRDEEMTERKINAVAQAIYRFSGWNVKWEEIHEDGRARFRKAARAALDAAAAADGEAEQKR